MKPFLSNLQTIWGQLGLNQKVSISVATLGVVVAMVALVVWANRPQMRLLYGDVSEKEMAAIVAQLQTEGIDYKLTAGGTAVHVPANAVHRARMNLASNGIPAPDNVGFEIFDKGTFGVSDFIQRTNFLRAVQGELARTISQLDSVKSARVMIVMPENRLLIVDPDVAPTASVFVDIGGGVLGPHAVRSIRALVANAVEGLRLDNVAVVDNHGNVLSTKLDEDGLMAASANQMNHRRELENYFSEKAEGMLSKVVGPGNAVVRVSVDLNTEMTTLTEERYDPESQVLRTQDSTEEVMLSMEGREQTAVGVGANLPVPVEGEADPSSRTRTERTQTQQTQSYEINRIVSNTVQNPGTIERMTAAVFIAGRVDGTGPEAVMVPRTTVELENIRQMVMNALGIRDVPGQEPGVMVQEVVFHHAPIPEGMDSAPRMNYLPLLEIGRDFLAIGTAIALLLLFLHLLRKSKPSLRALEVVNQEEVREARLKKAEMMPEVSAELLNELIRQKPDNAGAALRNWVAADSDKTG